MRMSQLPSILAISVCAGTVAAGGDESFCRGVMDCSLAGACASDAGSCLCDHGYGGTRCDTLLLSNNSTRSVRLPAARDVSTVWGGHPICDHAGTWHWFGSAIDGNCSLNAWSTNSFAAHAVASKPQSGVSGPFSLDAGASPARVLPPASSGSWDAGSVHDVVPLINPRPWANGSDAYLLFYTGFEALPNATAGSVPACSAATSAAAKGVLATRRIGVAFAPDPAGPWTRFAGNPVLGPGIPGAWDASTVSNAAPAFAANGTGAMLMAYKGLGPADAARSVCTDGSGRPCIGLAAAPHWSGPWARIEGISLNGSSAPWEGEDPSLYEGGRGWHMMFEHYVHDTRGSVGAHAWSQDGRAWHVAPHSAWYTTHTTLDGRHNVTLTKRERPQLVIERRPSHQGGATPIALFNGACDSTHMCFNMVDTLIN